MKKPAASARKPIIAAAAAKKHSAARPPAKRLPAKLLLRAVASDKGSSLVDFFVKRGGIPLAEATAAIARGGAYVGGKRVQDAKHVVKSGEELELYLKERGEAPAKVEALSVKRLLLLDPQVIAIDKPAGVLAQEGLAGGPDLATLTQTLLESRGEKGPALLVHRLDRGTTGVTLLARTADAQTKLLAAFRDGKVKKEYLGICQGSPKQDSFVVDLALGADETTAGRRRPDPLGQQARTRFRVLRRFPGATLLAAFPETGRTHQIRVHLSEQGFPLLGDVRYGGVRALTRADGKRFDFTRPMLHARSLTAAHPGGGRLQVEAPEPADMKDAVAFLADGAE